MKRLYYLVAISFLIVLGLLSRRIPFLPAETGDALWAVTLFCFLRALFTEWSLTRTAFASFLISYFVEFSQLIRCDWLVDVRSTIVGHLLLGQGFMIVDLLAYTLGIILIWYVASRLEYRYSRRSQNGSFIISQSITEDETDHHSLNR